MPSTLIELSKKVTTIKFELLAAKALLTIHQLALNYLEGLEGLVKERKALEYIDKQNYKDANEHLLAQVNAALLLLPDLHKQSKLVGGAFMRVPEDFDVSIYKKLWVFQSQKQPLLSQTESFKLFSQIIQQLMILPGKIKHLQLAFEQATKEKEQEDVRVMSEALDEFDRLERQQLEVEQARVQQQLFDVESKLLVNVSSYEKISALRRVYSDLNRQDELIADRMRQSESGESLSSEESRLCSSSSDDSLSGSRSTLWHKINESALRAIERRLKMNRSV